MKLPVAEIWSCKCIELAVMDSQLWVVPQFGGRAGNKNLWQKISILLNVMQSVRTLINRFHKRQGIYSLPEWLSASQEELSFMDLAEKVHKIFSLKPLREEAIWNTKA
jgi:hypothetical protein